MGPLLFLQQVPMASSLGWSLQSCFCVGLAQPDLWSLPKASWGRQMPQARCPAAQALGVLCM